MSINTESLQNADLQVVTQQIQQKEVTSRIAEVTLKDLKENGSANDTVWEGCGKMFLATDITKYEENISEDQKTLDEQVKALKIKQNYLKTSVEKTAASMKQILTGKA
ncbi:Prefoldin subunit 1 [Cyberlindnera fabianii]|uniref:Prefoldin subunit 1 n=1 Tax=Cyberlindnera fabianii TaxID=36022 RepID=A0A1V2LDU5_CYBFA|nr:Prefoldin subunit 1 [Cyberlindnera fabianii]